MLFPALESPRKTIECPLCGHQQEESALVVSTYCASCGAHLDISGELVKAPVRASLSGFKPTRSVADPDRDSASKRSVSRVKFPTLPFQDPFGRLSKVSGKIEITCYSCQTKFKVRPEATSCHCPKCGVRSSLEDITIKRRNNKAISTHGNVHILRSGKFSGPSLRCRNLIAEGKLGGQIHCSGELIIRNTLKSLSRVTCGRLLIQSKSEVTLPNGVSAESAEIDGTLHGDLSCSGKLVLKKKARLIGDLTTGSLIIEEGAHHEGAIKMGHQNRQSTP